MKGNPKKLIGPGKTASASAGLSRRGFLSRGLPAVAGAAAGLSMAAPSAVALAQSSESKLDTVLSRGRLIAGVTLTIPPWGFIDENGQPAGFDIEMAKIIANGLFGDPEAVEFFEQEMDARLPNLTTDRVDIAIQLMTVTAQRAQVVEFTIPYYREAVTTLHLADNPYSGAEDMDGQGTTVSILQNTFAEDLVRMAITDAAVEQFDSVANSILALDGGRVDAYVGGYGEISYFAAQEPGKYRVGNVGWIPQTYAAAVRPGDQRWLNFVNQVLHEAMTGVDFEAYATAFEKYFGVRLPLPEAGFPQEFR